MSAALAAASGPAITGYVEAMTATAVLGWAWMPGRATPLTVELRLDDTVVATAEASDLREDLARNGIGDGRHAFALLMPEAVRARSAEMRVFARAGDGPAIPIGSPPIEDGLKGQLAQLQQGMDLMVRSQRVLHRNVQVGLLDRAANAGPGPGEAEAAANQAAIQARIEARIEDSIATLEMFVVRLETSLAAQAPPPSRQDPRWMLLGAAGAAGLALMMSAWALLRSMPG